eukprot:GHVS01005009.1.p1 GENE.GHVS01005009.1~~GHVS01005009.1.p1  ORF type:complete len:230 (+),score=63.87 GHVS01005009.1:52-741(+)
MSASCPSLVINPYSLLSISTSASSTLIKSAYRKKARLCHPDKHPNDPTAHDRFNQLRDAYDLLLDVTKRKELDETLFRAEKKKERYEKQNVEKRKFKEELEAREKAAMDERKKKKDSAASAHTRGGRGDLGGWMHDDSLRKKRKDDEGAEEEKRRKERKEDCEEQRRRRRMSGPHLPSADVRVGFEEKHKKNETHDHKTEHRPPSSMTAAEFEAQTLQQLLLAAQHQAS